jgi:hypothetical protein
MFNLRNPIPKQIKDKKQLSEFFEQFGVVPMFGSDKYTGHAFTTFLNDLCDASPSFNAILNDFQNYAFGSRFVFVEGAYSGLEEQKVVEKAKEKEISDYLYSIGISLPNLVKVNKAILLWLEKLGNAYVWVRRIEVSGMVKYKISILESTNCAYLNEKDKEASIILYTPVFDAFFMNKYPKSYKLLAASTIENGFTWTKTGKGVEETIVHITKNKPETLIYENPARIISLLYPLLIENRMLEATMKMAGSEIVSKLILAMEKPNEQNEYLTEQDEIMKKAQEKEKGKHLKKLYTVQGSEDDVVGIGTVEYEYGGKPPVAIPLNLARDTAYSEWSINKATDFIYSVFGWSKQLNGVDGTRAGIGSDILVNLFLTKNIGTIQPMQEFHENCLNDLLYNIFTRENKTEYLNYGVKFIDRISLLTQNLTAANATKTTPHNTRSADTQSSAT